MRFAVGVQGSVADLLRGELDRVRGAVTAGITRTTGEVQALVRAQTTAAFGARAGGLARAWRATVYPRRPSLRAAGIVYTQAPQIVDAFERGATIRPGAGRKYLAIPTGFNTQRGRRGAEVRVTPEQMVASRASFVIPAKSGGARLWCLRLQGGQQASRGGLRASLGAGRFVEVATGRGGGRRAGGGRATRQGGRQARLIAQGFVPMFILVRQVTLPKRFDIEAAHRYAATRAAGNILQELGGP